MLFVYTGQPASTAALLARYHAWCNNNEPGPVQILRKAATTLADEGINLDNLARLVRALSDLDAAANIGIYTSEHHLAARLAQQHGVLYKPCGAGGGDLGVAISDQPNALDQCRQAYEAHHLVTIDLEMASHGLTVG